MTKTPPSQESRERAKAKRLAAALRANLRQRKAQARAMDKVPATSSDTHDKG